MVDGLLEKSLNISAFPTKKENIAGGYSKVRASEHCKPGGLKLDSDALGREKEKALMEQRSKLANNQSNFIKLTENKASTCLH